MDDAPTAAARAARDHWPFTLAAVHLAHTLWFTSLYPEGVYDPDLLAYFVYFKNWVAGITSLQSMSYFTVPKPLPVFLLGPLDNAQLAFAVSALAAAGFGALIYLICNRAFGRTAGVLCSLMVLLDVDRATLSMRSSADFFMTVLLFASIWATLSRRYAWSGVALLLAGLCKPVAIPCALHLLAIEGEDRKKAWLAAALPLVALPLTLLSNDLLLGSPFATQKLFSGFASMTEGTQMPTEDLLRFVLWVELAKTIFVSTAAFGVLGLVVWIGRDKSRLTNPFFLVPLLLLGGYLVLSVTTPFVAFFRFFWTVQVWFTCFIVYGIVETCRRLAPEPRKLQIAVTVAVLFFLFDEQLQRQMRFRSHFAGPFQEAMAFVGTTDTTLSHDRAAGETILTPLAFLPYLIWSIDDARLTPDVVRTAELHEEDSKLPPPDWILYVPMAFLSPPTREYVNGLLARGTYRPIMVSEKGTAALFMRTDKPTPLARADVHP